MRYWMWCLGRTVAIDFPHIRENLFFLEVTLQDKFPLDC